MSLQKLKTNIKTGITEVKTTAGMKHILLHVGLGAAVGILIDLLLEGLMWNFLAPFIKSMGWSPNIAGISIYPDLHGSTPNLAYDDLALLIITLLLLFTKKFWFVIGFFIGWYFSGRQNLYGTLGLPMPTTA